MNTQQKNFIFIIALSLGVIASFMQQTYSMNNSHNKYSVIAPFVRLYYPHSNPKTYKVHNDFYVETLIDQINYYQFNQYLYGDEFSSIYFDENCCHITGETSSGTIPRSDFCTKQFAMTHFHQNEMILGIVSAATAQTFYNNQNPAFIIPMGSLIQIQEVDQDNFKFLDPRGFSLFIAKKDIFIAHSLEQLNEQELRSLVVNQAKKLIGYPYQWGGLCACQGSGFDCTGFVHTIYRSCGKNIKRGVSGQFNSSKPINPSQLQPGDLIFAYHYNTIGYKIIDHVMLFVGDDTIIEASPFTKLVTQCTFESLSDKKIVDYQNDESIVIAGENYFISCRSLLQN